MYQRPGRIWIPEAPNIIIARKRELILPGPKVGLQGFFNVKLIDSRTGDVKRELNFKNLIVNSGLDALGNFTNLLNLVAQARAGTGGTAPAVGDTALQVQVGTGTNRETFNVSSGPSFAYWQVQMQYTFLEANANGNLAEIGLFASGGTMWTRQLLKDGTGTPTTITKTSAERLQVTYTMRLYSPTVDVTGNVTISGVVYAYTARASNINDTATWGSNPLVNFFAGGASASYGHETNVLGSTSGRPAGTEDGTTQDTSHSVTGSYTAGTFSREHTYFWDTNRANFGTGIGSITYGGVNSIAPMFQVSFGTQIPKNALKQLTLVTNISWGRYP